MNNSQNQTLISYLPNRRCLFLVFLVILVLITSTRFYVPKQTIKSQGGGGGGLIGIGIDRDMNWELSKTVKLF